MVKKYVSKSSLSLSVVLPTGGSAHVSFQSKMIGGSVFYTDDELLQQGLANHPKYGRLFKEEESFVQKDKGSNTSVKVDDSGNASSEGKKIKTMRFASNDDAKDYLATHFDGVIRSKLRNKESIVQCALSHGIEIEWEA